MRPSWKAGAVTLAAAIALSACGDGGGESQDASSDDTRTVESTFTGEQVEVPAEPQRVIALWRTGSELADLGVVPVAQLEGELIDSELEPEVFDKVADVPVVGSYEGVDIEKVIEADPDLIIGMDHGSLSIDYDELSEIAPTVIFKIAEPTDVWANYPLVAEAVGRSTDYEDEQAELEKSLAAIQNEYGEGLADLQVTSLGIMDGTIWVDTSKALLYDRITAAGFGYNPAYTDNPERYVTELAMENLPDLADQDAIFYDVGIDGTPDPAVQQLIDSPSFQALPAVKAGHAFPITSGTNYTFAGANKQVEDLRAAAEELTGN
ncbi:ABC transporter substrate-binding protein [Aeromicrobium piscarium]|uniref:ABC transporter substrate-binding protein n=1 Tax=Aeromicrobium piscarium TaxID=2590901 RepID=A0A554SGZ9_9ACTN|nr:ABC transporter substrate-binding protein [Aeromicrobium piscarium]TSD65617.1 ABC transporter substrate-binding protein [Aeromicrobium piscarium]